MADILYKWRRYNSKTHYEKKEVYEWVEHREPIYDTAEFTLGPYKLYSQAMSAASGYDLVRGPYPNSLGDLYVDLSYTFIKDYKTERKRKK